MYMAEVKEHDERIADTWKEDATGLVVFVSPNLSTPAPVVMTASKTGLFAAVVAAFIIESYKKLSPDTGDETVVLLRQISRQLAGFTNGTSPTQATTEPPSPNALIVCVNVLWLTSLVLSIASALFATLLQQWARRYIQKPQIPREPSKQARIRSFLNLGTVKFKMRPVVEIAPTLLHLAVSLFFVGLGMFFVPIHKTVGIIVSVVVGLFGLAYLALTILPCIKHNCPYRTPMTVLFWYSWHTILFYVARFLRWAMRRLHDCLVEENPDDQSPGQEILVKWLQSREGAVERHMGCLEHGLDQSAIENAPVDEDRRTLSWLLNVRALVDKSKLRNFVASIPRKMVVQLMTPPIESGAMVLREPLLTLVRSYAGTTAVGPDEPLRRRSLFVCLEAVRLVAEASIDPNAVPEEVLRDIRINFANINLMRAMWADDDAAIRLTSRSICALLARSLIHRGELDRPELTWLQDVTEATANAISNSPITELYHINRKSFVCGVLSPPMGGGLPTDHVASFERILAILMGAVTQADSDIDRTVLGTELQTFFQRMEDDGHGDNSAVSTLRRMYQSIT